MSRNDWKLATPSDEWSEYYDTRREIDDTRRELEELVWENERLRAALLDVWDYFLKVGRKPKAFVSVKYALGGRHAPKRPRKKKKAAATTETPFVIDDTTPF